MKQTIEIEVPEGYEVAEGLQPRRPKVNEYYLNPKLGPTLSQCDFGEREYIILKKKAPEYKQFTLDIGDAYCKAVEIKALEDALSFAPVEVAELNPTYKALKELVKGDL